MYSTNLQTIGELLDKILAPSDLPSKILTKCTFCSKEFIQWRYEYIIRETKFNGKRYCSRDCYNKNRPFRYNDYYYCDNCLEWIPQNEAININSQPTCPKHSCCNNKLRIRSPRPKFNLKRNQSKRIE